MNINESFGLPMLGPDGLLPIVQRRRRVRGPERLVGAPVVPAAPANDLPRQDASGKTGDVSGPLESGALGETRPTSASDSTIGETRKTAVPPLPSGELSEQVELGAADVPKKRTVGKPFRFKP